MVSLRPCFQSELVDKYSKLKWVASENVLDYSRNLAS